MIITAAFTQGLSRLGIYGSTGPGSNAVKGASDLSRQICSPKKIRRPSKRALIIIQNKLLFSAFLTRRLSSGPSGPGRGFGASDTGPDVGTAGHFPSLANSNSLAGAALRRGEACASGSSARCALRSAGNHLTCPPPLGAAPSPHWHAPGLARTGRELGQPK
jgi:hypothetical protein